MRLRFRDLKFRRTLTKPKIAEHPSSIIVADEGSGVDAWRVAIQPVAHVVEYPASSSPISIAVGVAIVKFGLKLTKQPSPGCTRHPSKTIEATKAPLRVVTVHGVQSKWASVRTNDVPEKGDVGLNDPIKVPLSARVALMVNTPALATCVDSDPRNNEIIRSLESHPKAQPTSAKVAGSGVAAGFEVIDPPVMIRKLDVD